MPNNYNVLQNYSHWYHEIDDVVELNFEHEMNKLSITNLSTLELNLNTQGHAFGALMFRLLEMHHIRTAIQGLKVILPESCQVFLHAAYISYT